MFWSTCSLARGRTRLHVLAWHMGMITVIVEPQRKCHKGAWPMNCQKYLKTRANCESFLTLTPQTGWMWQYVLIGLQSRILVYHVWPCYSSWAILEWQSWKQKASLSWQSLPNMNIRFPQFWTWFGAVGVGPLARTQSLVWACCMSMITAIV